MIVKKVKDFKDVNKILFDPEIYERIKVDGVEVKEWPKDNTIYIGGYVDGEIIALMVYYKRKKYTTCHPYVIRKYRGRFGYSFVRKAFELRPCDILYTNILPKFDKVIKFAEHFGFKYIGIGRGYNLYRVEL